MSFLISWKSFRLASAFLAGLTAIFGKLGVESLNSNPATLIRTVVVAVIAMAIFGIRIEWQ